MSSRSTARVATVWTIVVAGGSGTRFGGPKQYAALGDERVLDRSRRIAESISDGVVVVVPPADAEREGAVAGGATRSDSVRAGLAAVPPEAEIVCVHDAVRPLASPELYERVIAAVAGGADAAVPAVPVTDTIKVIDEARRVVQTLDRSVLIAVQTPQAFRRERLVEAHASGDHATDDATLVEQVGGKVVAVEGEPANRKITVPTDLERAHELEHQLEVRGGGLA